MAEVSAVSIFMGRYRIPVGSASAGAALCLWQRNTVSVSPGKCMFCLCDLTWCCLRMPVLLSCLPRSAIRVKSEFTDLLQAPFFPFCCFMALTPRLLACSCHDSG